MKPLDLHATVEINNLWKPVYPYLSQQICEFYHREDGNILEIGPFSGVIFELKKRNIGHSHLIAAFPPEMVEVFKEEVKKQKLEEEIRVMKTDIDLTGVEEGSIDLAIFRGAFFFPSIFQVNLSAIYKVLKINGVGFIGGGFGKFTPDHILKEIGKKSRDLNLQIGKIEVSEEKLQEAIQKEDLKGELRIISEGGLWLLMRKGLPAEKPL